MVGVDSLSRTPKRRTLQLVTRIGGQPICVLVDSGSTGNCIDAQEWIAHEIKIETEDHTNALKMADGIVVKTEGRVYLVLKENPRIYWTQAVVVVQQDHQWILLPLAKPKLQNPVHLANEISATQVDHMLRRNRVERAIWE